MTQSASPEAPATYVAAAAALLGLPLDPAWAASVVDNFTVLKAAADRVAAFSLPDEAEAATVFEA